MLEIHPGGSECPYINRKFPLYNKNKECVGIIQHVKYLEIFTPNDFIKEKRPGSILLSCPDNFFTETECEVIFLKLQGMSSKDIGKVLCRSGRTIESTVSRLYNKSGVNNNTDFVEFCEKRNLHRYLPPRFLNYKRVSFENDSFFNGSDIYGLIVNYEQASLHIVIPYISSG